MDYEELAARIVMWARTQPTIRALIMVGSRARGTSDRWSDLDIVIFSSERERYTAVGWPDTFGDAWLRYQEITGGGDPNWFALYEDGLKLDAVLLHIDDDARDLELILAEHPYHGVFARGVKVLYDRLAPPRLIAAKPFTTPAEPSAEAFDALVSRFLADALSCTRFIERGDLWRAQRWLSIFLRDHLLKMIEWQAHRDTGFGGRFIERWADARVIAALPQTFALYERESLRQAVRAMLDLFHWMGEEVARRCGLAYPAAMHERIVGLVEATFAEPG